MDQETSLRQAVNSALSRLLRPLFKLLLRHGVSYGSFEQLARKTFVETAFAEAGLNGKRPTISRIAILSGLTRKEVQRLAASTGGALAVDQYNRAARVLTGWIRDPEFHGANGRPKALDFDGSAGFAGLVKRHSGDVPARAVLDELKQVGAVLQHDDGRIELIERGYVPSQSVVEKLRILGIDVADLIATIDHNLVSGPNDPRYQRKVMYRSMPASSTAPFRRLSAKQSQDLLERMDRWLAQHDIDDPPEGPGLARVRMGLGIYYFEEALEAASPTAPSGDDS